MSVYACAKMLSAISNEMTVGTFNNVIDEISRLHFRWNHAKDEYLKSRYYSKIMGFLKGVYLCVVKESLGDEYSFDEFSSLMWEYFGY